MLATAGVSKGHLEIIARGVSAKVGPFNGFGLQVIPFLTGVPGFFSLNAFLRTGLFHGGKSEAVQETRPKPSKAKEGVLRWPSSPEKLGRNAAAKAIVFHHPLLSSSQGKNGRFLDFVLNPSS